MSLFAAIATALAILIVLAWAIVRVPYLLRHRGTRLWRSRFACLAGEPPSGERPSGERPTGETDQDRLQHPERTEKQ